ncbi:site-specific integrase [Clostridium felsineum]|uniref:site-specific integrase n=1 Tax=Clostridium felsineum TaxID=36839 RepID=UPI00098C98CC|nr:site-specific integrase [Clostridium felsineum]URZ15294.1 Putative defective protein IntQ [Clostridium felsineum DSM 794]
MAASNTNIKQDSRKLYWFKISLGTDPKTGKRRQTTRRGFKNQKEAIEEYNKLKNEYYAGTLIYNKSTKIKAFIEEYKKWYKTQVRITTYENRISSIDKNIVNYFGEYSISKITPLQIEKWHQYLLENGNNQNYVRNLHIMLSAIFERAITLGVVNINPVKKAGNVKRVKTEVQFWTKDELDQVLNTFDKNDLLQYFGFIMIHFLFYTGLRFSEMQALQWKDISKDKILKITRDLNYKNKDTWQFDNLKNDSSIRDIIIDDITCKLLLDWQEVQKTLFNSKKDSFIFSLDGLPTNKFFPKHAIERHSKKAGIKKIKVHALRHSHASFLISLDVNIIAIAQRLGHTDVREVLKTYGHLYPRHQFDVVQNINTFLAQNKKRGQ